MGSKQSDHHLLHPYRINLSLIGKQPNCLLLQNNLISIIFKNKLTTCVLITPTSLFIF